MMTEFNYFTWLLAAAPIDRFLGPNDRNDLFDEKKKLKY